MISITIEKSDLRFRDRLRWNTVARRLTTAIGEEMSAAVRAEAPVGKKEIGGHNGQLRDSITYHNKIGARSASVEIVSNVEYAEFVIKGTPPHVIVPVQASRLHWVQGGNSYYRYRVNHPGTKPNPFPARALRPLTPRLQREMSATVQESLGA